MNPPLAKVLIVGAGPVGLAMGCELLQQGIPCRVIEQARPAKAPPAASGVVILHARTLEVLATLQVLDEALALGLKIHSFTLHDGKSHIASISTEDADTPYPYNLVLPQAELSRILETRLVRLGGAVERGLQCKSLTQDQDGVTAAVVRQGGLIDKVRAPWLIGCDGDKSAVRQAAGLKWEGSAEDEACAVADVVLEPSLARDEVNIALSASGVLFIIPLPGAGRARLIHEGASLPESLTLEYFQALLGEHGLEGVTLRDPGWIGTLRAGRRIAASYQARRVFLVGSAAHTHGPAGAQDFNLGVQDAHNLAWKIGLLSRGKARDALLDSYTDERRPIAAATLEGSDAALRAIAAKVRVPKEARDALLRLLTGLEPVQRRLAAELEELDLSYRKSAIVSESKTPLWRARAFKTIDHEAPSMRDVRDFSAAPQAGDRAPDVEFGPARERLFSLTRSGQHTLLMFDGAASTSAGYAALDRMARAVKDLCGNMVNSYLIMPVAQRPIDLGYAGAVMLDPEGRLHRRYGAGSECLYLIRPDGVIAFRGQPAEQEPLLAYLHKIFIDRWGTDRTG